MVSALPPYSHIYIEQTHKSADPMLRYFFKKIKNDIYTCRGLLAMSFNDRKLDVPGWDLWCPLDTIRLELRLNQQCTVILFLLLRFA